MTQIKGKTALITGGASGIGKAIGKLLIQHGIDKLIIWDKNQAQLFATVKEFQNFSSTIYYSVIDISKTEEVIVQIKKLEANISNVDILINNAGIVVGKYFHEHSHKEIDDTMQVNSIALMHLSLELLSAMISKNQGHIVNIASAAGLVQNPKMSVYCASKFAVVGWSDSLYIELKRLKSNVKVTTIEPYYINTGMFDGVKSNPLLPILKQEYAAEKIIKAIIDEKRFLRMPLLIQLTPFVKGILPAFLFDFFVGKVLGVYNTMNKFKGHKNG